MLPFHRFCRLGPPRRAAAGLALLLAASASTAPLHGAAQHVAVASTPAFSPNLPALGDDGALPLSEERRIGDRIVRGIYRDPDHLDDPALQAYLQRIWQPLLAAAQARGEVSPELAERFAWQLLLARDRSINAFALPGGYFGIHLGLMASVATADELASVLAHELSHVSQRHIARLLTQQERTAPWMVAAMLLGALAASQSKNADLAGAAIAGGQAVALQSQLNFSRDMEREADRVGFGVLSEAGFERSGFVTMFDKLQQAARLNDDGSFAYLRSHPLTTERIADMRARVQLDADPGHSSAEHTRHDASATAIHPSYHALMAARARVLAETDIDRLRALVRHGDASASAPLHDATTLGARYAATLAAARLRNAPAALRGLQALQAAPPSDAAARDSLRWLALEVLHQLQLPQGAGQDVATLRQQALASPQRDALLLGASTALNAPAAVQRQATEQLRTWTAQHPGDALAWQTLAALHRAQQQPVAAARAEAEAQLAQQDAPGALARFKAAQSLARRQPVQDHYELSILDARTHATEQRVRDELREERERRQGGASAP